MHTKIAALRDEYKKRVKSLEEKKAKYKNIFEA